MTPLLYRAMPRPPLVSTRFVAARLAVDLREVYDKDRAVKLAYSPFLDRLVAVNTFYSRLVRA
ncbi:MAG: hypothetical protein ACRDQ2_12315, partial [Gaiellales bacterium]